MTSDAAARGRKEPAHPTTSVTWRQAMAYRVRQHHLDRRQPRTALLEVVAQLGGVQAQLMSSAELALWARLEDLSPETVPRELWEERRLVKTWAMRGTLHLLPSSELRLWQTVPNLDRRYLRESWLRYFELTAGDLERLTAAVAEALDGRLLTREELVSEVSRLLGSEDLGGKLRHSWGMMLKPAAFRCLLCFGPSTGQNVRFTRPDSWLSGLQEVDPAQAEREVTLRFLRAYGPTTREAYALWLGIPAARAGRLITSLGEGVTAVDVEGMPAWALTDAIEHLTREPAPGSVRLLPAFDQYVIGASRYAVNLLPGPFKDRIYRPQGWLSPVLLVDGRMDGVWRHERKGKRLLVQIEPFLPVPLQVRRAAEAEAERLAAFLGGRLEVTLHEG